MPLCNYLAEPFRTLRKLSLSDESNRARKEGTVCHRGLRWGKTWKRRRRRNPVDER